jgi:hypothetical protein
LDATIASIQLSKFVIPAKAGTQLWAGERVGSWIPAFAGMTVSGEARRKPRITSAIGFFDFGGT